MSLALGCKTPKIAISIIDALKKSFTLGFDACSACGEEMIWPWEKEEVACGGEAIWSWKEEEEEEEDKGVLKRVESWVEKDQIVWYDVR